MTTSTQSAPPIWRDARVLKVLGMGVALPGPPVSNEELLDRVTSLGGVAVARRGVALARRLGIETRHICRDFAARRETPRSGHSNPDLAAQALGAALAEAKLAVKDLTYLIGHTTTPARLSPPNVAMVVDRLGFTGPYMELRQACTGFANALVVAQGLLASPGAHAVAIVGSETGSVYFDPQRANDEPAQLVNLMQMGDGAAAIILAADDGLPGARLGKNFFGHVGANRDPGFTLLAGGSDLPFVENGVLEFAHDCAQVKMNGPMLFDCGVVAAQSLGIALQDVDRVIPHQANGRMAELLGPYLGIAPQRIFVNAQRVGNTGSAALWLALAELRSALFPGERVLALGAEATKYMFGGFSYCHGESHHP